MPWPDRALSGGLSAFPSDPLAGVCGCSILLGMGYGLGSWSGDNNGMGPAHVCHRLRIPDRTSPLTSPTTISSPLPSSVPWHGCLLNASSGRLHARTHARTSELNKLLDSSSKLAARTSDAFQAHCKSAASYLPPPLRRPDVLTHTLGL